MMALSRVDFPAPLPPITVTMLPGATEILALLTAATLPYQADKSRTCKTACCGLLIMPPGGTDPDRGPVCRRRRPRRPSRRLCRRDRTRGGQEKRLRVQVVPG